jgi:hypothetical protein
LTVACLLAGCGAGTELAGLPSTGASTATTPESSAGNERVLSAAESARLVAWLGRFRACHRERGVETDRMVVTRRELSLRTRKHLPTRSLLNRSLPCGESLGDPPTSSSLQVRPGDDRIVLYLPKQCLLDPKVAGRAA